ncbi:hemolysin [Anaerocolumna cellulosilytica]|uniref:Hemolysin n=1 Tax=Anaerocolumna cellulosilytica TaxID=433286 RepID=A0A6S6R3B8_9FIRM|nr:hemolysin family protein [Anaerocolumna cellulosilytica]MBB5196741.1 putative hemolysin [Anaerocolumna cellulosilytica]BCJ94002.1 hemolysin [Anaerocolumna cellulosilytica]
MNDNIIWQIILQVILIAFNAVFACAEIAVISINDNKLAKMAAEGNKKAIRLATLTSQPARFLSTIQVAITLSGFLGSAFAADNFSEYLTTWLVSLGVTIPEKTLDTIAVIVITIILSYFTLIFGELVPKRVAMKKAESLALGMSALITFISKLFAPVVWLLTASTNGILKLIGIDPNEEDENVSEEEIRMMIDMGREKGTIDQDEQELIQNVFEFDDLTAGEIATHRTEISLLWMDESPEAWEKTIHESRHSLYPVCDESVDNVVGVLNAKDYFRLEDKSREQIMKHAVKPAYFVPETVKADLLFRNMKHSHNYFAIVLDEYGGMSGIVTVNDLVEQLVGEFDDDNGIIGEVSSIERIDSTTWKLNGSIALLDVAKQLGISLPIDDYDTFGGFVFGLYGSIPEDGTTLELDTDTLHIKVLEIKDHLINKAVICLNTLTTEALPAESAE